MKRSVVGIIIFLLFVSSFPGISNKQETNALEVPQLERAHITDLHVILDPNLTDTEFLLQNLTILDDKNYTDYYPNGFESKTTLNISYSLLSSAQRSDFVSYLKGIENTDSPNGHDFNSTAYENNESRVFTNVTGRSYDADLALNWLADNLWDKSPNRYSLFVFNFTDLDQGMDHWFTIKPPDVDTGEVQSSFFSGTSGLIHGKSVSGWGGYQDLPIHFLDLSSETWWGDFINTVYGEYGWSDTYLSQKLQDLQGNDTGIIQSWISEYVISFIEQTYELDVFGTRQIGQSVKVQNKIMYDWYEYNYTIDDNKWLISSDKINHTFSNSFSWLEFNITDEWYNLTDYGSLVNELNKYKTPKDDGSGYYIELETGLYSYLKNEFIPNNFEYSGEDIILPSLVFFFNQSTFTWGGLPIAGLGGSGFQIQGLTPERYYGDDGTPNRGFSDVILHEVGHSMGLPHPFDNYDEWAGDMTASVMGYYTSAPDFSQYDVNTLGYHYSDYYLMQVEYYESQYDGSDPRANNIAQYLEIANQKQQEWNFEESIEDALVALCGYYDIYDTEDKVCDDVDLSVLNETSPDEPTDKKSSTSTSSSDHNDSSMETSEQSSKRTTTSETTELSSTSSNITPTTSNFELGISNRWISALLVSSVVIVYKRKIRNR